MTEATPRPDTLSGDTSLDLPEFDSPPDEPIALLRDWFDAAKESVREPLAATLSTSSPETGPSSRTVLVKGLEDDGTILVTTAYRTRKGQEMEQTQRAALTFYWRETVQQVNVTGRVERVTEQTAQSLFERRPIDARAASAVSETGRPLDDEAALADRARALADSGEVERPGDWGGYRITPDLIEFWHGRSTRLHRRLSYERRNEQWAWKRLQP